MRSLQQPRVDVVGPLAAAGLLDHDRNQVVLIMIVSISCQLSVVSCIRSGR